MQKLVKGIHEFQNNVFRSHSDLFKQLSKGQNPEVLFITCSDSRIVPNLLTQTDPGDLFLVRNAGNIVPRFHEMKGGTAATIEYAVEALNVTDVIVCGHSQCGAMSALLAPEMLDKLPVMKGWLENAAAARRILDENYGHLEGQARYTALVEENVLVQLDNLRTHPCIASRLADARVRLHGWVYQLETGRVFSYDHDTGQFGPIEEVEVRAPESGRIRKPNRSI